MLVRKRSREEKKVQVSCMRMDMLVQAATIVCVRRSSSLPKQSITLDQLRLLQSEHKDEDSRWLHRLGGSGEALEFRSRWEVLMGQSEVQNWLKSTPSQAAVMRYPGEMKFPGGTKDATDASMEAVARRELEEEFLTVVPADAKLRLFSVKRTKPVRGVAYMMHNFIALIEENPWLQKLEVGTINRALEERRAKFGVAVNDESFWGLPPRQKEVLSPEVRRVDWIPLRDAAWNAMTSKADPTLLINEFQRTEFERLGVKVRDPMFQTMWILLDLDRYPTSAELIAHCEALPSPTELAAEASASFARVDQKKIQEEDATRVAAEELRLQLLAANHIPTGSTTSMFTESSNVSVSSL